MDGELAEVSDRGLEAGLPEAALRVASIDIARGAMMALMALDHVRMYLTEATFDPTDVARTDIAYFTARWLTHLCAPGFFFLAGLSVHLAEAAGLAPLRSSMLLLARGVWLAILEMTVIGFAWSFTPGWHWFGVVWSLGMSMVCLAVLRWVTKPLLAASAAAFLLLHNILPIPVLIPHGASYELLYGAGSALGRWVLFPLLPWLSFMVLGFSAGPWLMPRQKLRQDRLMLVGIIMTAAFAAARIIGLGQPAAARQTWPADLAKLAMDFMNVEKYPPSAQYALVTLGVLSMGVAFIDLNEHRRWPSLTMLRLMLLAFGRTPLFFYVLHLFIIHAATLVLALAVGWQTSGLFWHAMPDLIPPPGFGLPLVDVLLTWLGVLALLAPACLWFARRKNRFPGLWTKFV